MALKIGMHTGQQDIEMDELRRLWRFADENGFDFLSIWDHLYEAGGQDPEKSPCFEAVACMAAMAAETKNVQLGCHVFCMNYRNPGLLANSMVTIDHITGGRLEVGLGSGWHVREHEAYGFGFPPTKERMDRLEEGIQVVRMLFQQERSDFSGEYYTLDDATLYPRPVQARIPIVVGGRGEKRTLRTAAKYADGWNVPYINSEEFLRLNGVLDEWCEKEDRDPATIDRSVNLHMEMGATQAAADRISAERAARSIRGAGGGGLTGPPKQAIETMKHYEGIGAGRISIAIRPPVEWESLQAFVDEVMPALK